MPKEFDLVVAEHRRVLTEVEQLRARVAALESSRWWRLHPRFALRRLRQRLVRENRSSEEVLETADEVESVPTESDPMIARFRAEVVARGTFGSDFFTGNIPSWELFLGELDGREARILEIGSFEGMSACYFLWRLPDARLTCVDTFAGSAEHPVLGVETGALEQAFDGNVSLVDRTRVRKIVGASGFVLQELIDEGERFDVVYVDGSHLAFDVIVDASLSWQLLAPDGIVIYDDYRWGSPLGEDPLLRPRPAIDAFLTLVEGHYEVLIDQRQLVVQRTDPAFTPNVAAD